MTKGHGRSASVEAPGSPTIKKQKLAHAATSANEYSATSSKLESDETATSSKSNGNGVSNNSTHPLPRSVLGHLEDAANAFLPELFDHNRIAKLNSTYTSNQPYKFGVVEKLFRDELLKKVKDECLSELNFTEKETDIYKVNQTGDLASLNYLTSTQISLLPNLLVLRDALYSSKFRRFLQAVTGCGPLSGTKQGMSVNSYTKGCHLLNHDDVIGTRRVSYILYMPLPHHQTWQKEWGGALELYPVKPGEDGQLEPVPMPSKSIPPSWNQFIFFEVQPGRSFHSVEEVVVGSEEDGRERLSISGWFHAAQEGEEGYVSDSPAEVLKSSREQLASTETAFSSYSESVSAPLPDVELSEEHIAFLSEFLNPVYLQPRTMKALAARFVEESSLQLHSFLCSPLADNLEPRLLELDTKDGLGRNRAGVIPSHSSGTNGTWSIKGPPHKWRYCVLKPHGKDAPAEAVSPRAAHGSSDEILRSLQDELFPSPAFRAWLAIVSHLLPLRYSIEARRFRPGLDYTLATSEEKEARLDVTLGLTPETQHPPRDGDNKGKKKAQQQPAANHGWQAEWGGWECYMAPHNEEDDPAVYRSSTQKKPKTADAEATTSKASSHSSSNSSGSPRNEQSASKSPSPMDEDDEEEGGEEDSTLLTVQPGFNRLLLVLRDERVMRFVKYVSAAAEGSRWDVCGEYEVGMIQEDSDEDGSGDGDWSNDASIAE